MCGERDSGCAQRLPASLIDSGRFPIIPAFGNQCRLSLAGPVATNAHTAAWHRMRDGHDGFWVLLGDAWMVNTRFRAVFGVVAQTNSRFPRL